MSMLSRKRVLTHQRIYFTALPTRREQEEHGRFLANLILKRFSDPEVQRLAKAYLSHKV